MNRNIIILTSLSLIIVVLGILLTTYGIIKLSNLTVEKEFSSTILDDEFDLFIYTPPAYSLQYKQSYPVLYVLDGDNYFIERKEERRTKWSMQKTIDRLIKEERLPALIVIGITPANKRTDYYLPPSMINPQVDGQAEEFVQFITDELKPYIDTKYRTKSDREHTGIFGAGLGGLASLYISSTVPDIFGKVGALGTIKDESESYLTIQDIMQETENLQHDLFDLGYHQEQDVYLLNSQLIGASEDVLDQHLENVLLHLFAQ